MSRVKIEVTEQDIRSGEPRTGDKCPVALAIIRRTGIERIRLSVEEDQVRIRRNYKDWGWGVTPVPKKVVEFISRFDNGKPVKPLSFMLELEREGGE